MIRAGQAGYLINEFAKGYVAVGWSQLGDLSGIKSREQFKQLGGRLTHERNRAR